MIRSVALLAATTGTGSAIGIQLGVNMPTSLASLEVEFPVGPHAAIGVGGGVMILPTDPGVATLPAASMYYRYFPNSPQEGVFFGGRLGSNILLTTATATAGYRLNLGQVYLDGEIGVGAGAVFFMGAGPALSAGVNIGFRF
ncbi:hypothetical protein [Deinococcus pimensis]|uniref:hypothetical protein n=1 Tax=Deinococcus pimensis TaxID=309888 RepID=UPI0012FAB947|nr:hypothetical protein [Deinococcus pimensis]